MRDDSGVAPPSALFRVVNPPAPADEVAALIGRCGEVPASYREFLARSDGAEWCVHDRDGDCLALWSAREIAETNEAYSIPRWVPEFLAIGSDGGGQAIGFDRAASDDAERWPVVRVGFGCLDREEFLQLAPGFRFWWAGEFSLQPLAID